MSFFDPIRLKLSDDEQFVVLAIWANETRVDEYCIEIETFDEFAREALILGEWVGPDYIQAKNHGETISIAIRPYENKRDIYRFNMSQYHIMIALYFASLPE